MSLRRGLCSLQSHGFVEQELTILLQVAASHLFTRSHVVSWVVHIVE